MVWLPEKLHPPCDNKLLNIIEELTDVQFAVNNRTVIVNRK